MRQMVADVTVVGTGIIALSAAIEIADRGHTVRLVGTTHAGNASTAAGGMLAPSIGRLTGPAQTFAVASRERYPGFVAALSERSGRRIPINSAGILEVALDESEMASFERSFEDPSVLLSAADLAAAEPAIGGAFGGAFGGILHPLDGCVEPLLLLDALSAIVAAHQGIMTAREDCCEIRTTDLGCTVLTSMESRFVSLYVVLAAGAWTPMIVGSGNAVASVRPVRGQMLALQASPLRHVTCGAGGYLIPRSDGVTVAGGTMEHTGFDASTTAEGLEHIHARAAALCPTLADAAIHSSWAGLRPITPDLLPIMGADPERERVIYACGHSRNGILLAPLTAEVVADIISGVRPRHDIAQFRPGRH